MALTDKQLKEQKEGYSLHSPKNKFRAEIHYSKPLAEIGSVSSALGMTLDQVKHRTKFYTEQASRNGASSAVVIFENLKAYPNFDWKEVERYEVS